MFSTNDEMKKAVLEMIFHLSRNEWEGFINNLSNDVSLDQLSDYASNLSVIAAEVEEYLGYRGGYGCGDHGHDDAIKAVEKQRKKVRRALNYSYP